MSEMTKDEIRNFLLQGTFTGKLGTISKNGTTHVVQSGIHWMKKIISFLIQVKIQ
jgi:hypothetical protein